MDFRGFRPQMELLVRCDLSSYSQANIILRNPAKAQILNVRPGMGRVMRLIPFKVARTPSSPFQLITLHQPIAQSNIASSGGNSSNTSFKVSKRKIQRPLVPYTNQWGSSLTNVQGSRYTDSKGTSAQIVRQESVVREYTCTRGQILQSFLNIKTRRTICDQNPKDCRDWSSGLGGRVP